MWSWKREWWFLSNPIFWAFWIMTRCSVSLIEMMMLGFFPLCFINDSSTFSWINASPCSSDSILRLWTVSHTHVLCVYNFHQLNRRFLVKRFSGLLSVSFWKSHPLGSIFRVLFCIDVLSDCCSCCVVHVWVLTACVWSVSSFYQVPWRWEPSPPVIFLCVLSLCSYRTCFLHVHRGPRQMV